MRFFVLFFAHILHERAFWEFVDIEDAMEEGIDAREEFQAPKNFNFEEEFRLHDIVD